MKQWPVTLSLLLAGCGGTQQALLASGGYNDFREMGDIAELYGTGDPAVVIPVSVGDQEYRYRVWISKNGMFVMVQTDSMAGAAAAGFARGLTMGLATGDQDYPPFEQAASTYLASTYGPGCILQNVRKITHIGYEWKFDCAARQAANPKRETKNRR